MIENLNHELSEYFKLLRFKKKVSQEEIADQLEISRNTYSKWETNPVALSLNTLKDIADRLDGNIIIFFTEYVAKSNNEEKMKLRRE